MANTIIQIRNSTVSGNTPAELQPGELAINIEDGDLYYGNSNGVVTLFDAVTEPAGLDGEIQFNDMGSFGSNSQFVYDYTTGILTVPNIQAFSGTIGSYDVGPGIEQALTSASSAGSYANSAFSVANTASDTATSAGSYANSAYAKANTAAGANGEIQFNLNGLYGTSSNLYYQTSNNTLFVDTLEAMQNVDAQNIVAYNKFYAGIATNLATPLPYLIAQFTGNTAPYVQVNAQNIDPLGSADYVVTGDVGDDETFFITTGMQGSQLEQGVLYPLDGYLIVQGNTSQLGGNLTIGAISGTPGIKTRIVANGYEVENVVAEFGNDEIVLNREIVSNTTSRIYNHANAAFEFANNITISGGSSSGFGIINVSNSDIVFSTSANDTINFFGSNSLLIFANNETKSIYFDVVAGLQGLSVDYGLISDPVEQSFDYGTI
jgi:hypothetical protein